MYAFISFPKIEHPYLPRNAQTHTRTVCDAHCASHTHMNTHTYY